MDSRKTGVRCKGRRIKDGGQCFYRARPGLEFCCNHQGGGFAGTVRPVETIRLSNIKGQAHTAVAEALYKCGISVVNQNGGWPDLLVKKANKLFAVEVKRGGDTLKDNQRRVLRELTSLLPCFVLRLDAPCNEGEITWAKLLEHLNVEPEVPEYFGA